MPTKTAVLALFVVMSACAAHRNTSASASTIVLQEKSPGLYLGHSDNGEVVIAATHYDAMNGLAVLDSDLGLAHRNDSSGAMMCKREMPTGTHVPHWMCRYVDDIAHERQVVLNTLQQPAFNPSGPGVGVGVVAGGGGGGSKTQSR